MHSNDLEACGMKCCYFLFHSEVNFFMRSLFLGERQWPFGPLVNLFYLALSMLDSFNVLSEFINALLTGRASAGNLSLFHGILGNLERGGIVHSLATSFTPAYVKTVRSSVCLSVIPYYY